MDSIRIIMAGNPNVGKSSLFNLFTGSRQHTGNWPGKTVGSACGVTQHKGHRLVITDTPGTYSLRAVSDDEANARDSILFAPSDCVIVVCDACCAERSLFPALQIMEAKENVVICFNLMDEARAKGISIDIPLLEKRLGCPVVGVSAARKENLSQLLDAAVERSCSIPRQIIAAPLREALLPLAEYFDEYRPPLPGLWLARQVVCGDAGMINALKTHLGLDVNDTELASLITHTKQVLANAGFEAEMLGELSDLAIKTRAAQICTDAISRSGRIQPGKDPLLSKPAFAHAAMPALLFLVLWLSIFAAEHPGKLLSAALSQLGNFLESCLFYAQLPPRLVSLLVRGVYETMATVVAVMLPPMAIFYPLFSLLEDWGFLPRLAFNMDPYFKKCGGCGKQALTMCMGLGCNTVGINGCRIIGSPREKAIAVLTNSFMPCNGRFPLLIGIASYIFRDHPSPQSSLFAAAAVMAAILLGALTSLAASVLLSATILKGEASAFVLEIPPLRRPAFLQSIKRALLDRTLFVLLRALKFAAPAGLLIWLLANLHWGETSLLRILSDFFDPAAQLIGLDGAILLAFILGLPASEIVLPVILMCYLSADSLSQTGHAQLAQVLSANGWDTVKALCMMVFTVLHWPCISSLAAIREETGKWRYVLLGTVLPAAFGIIVCAVIRLI